MDICHVRILELFHAHSKGVRKRGRNGNDSLRPNDGTIRLLGDDVVDDDDD